MNKSIFRAALDNSAKENRENRLGWPSFIDDLIPFVEKLPGLPGDFKDPLLRQETLRWLFSQAAQGYFGLIYQDTRYPDFWPVYNQAFNFGFPNPDDAYYMAVVDDDGVYAISGYRESVRMVDFQVCSNLMMAYGLGATSAKQLSPPTSNYNIDQGVEFGDDGSFQVILSAQRPEGYTGDWWKLESGSTFILVRQRAYNWLREVDARLTIERLDVPAIRPRPGAEDIAERLAAFPLWMENWTRLMLDFGVGLRSAGLVNKLGINEQPGGVSLQKYVMGMFDLAEDEALILETDIPETCEYWMFHLTDEMMASIDPMNRQTSLNGHQARLDGDGKFRAVISARDPGVPNWLDNGGYQRGGIVGRWMYSSSYPLPRLAKVKAAEVSSYLPQDTPEVLPAERDKTIRVRRRGAQMRRRW